MLVTLFGGEGVPVAEVVGGGWFAPPPTVRVSFGLPSPSVYFGVAIDETILIERVAGTFACLIYSIHDSVQGMVPEWPKQ